jgi:hypothetical protein
VGVACVGGVVDVAVGSAVGGVVAVLTGMGVDGTSVTTNVGSLVGTGLVGIASEVCTAWVKIKLGSCVGVPAAGMLQAVRIIARRINRAMLILVFDFIILALIVEAGLTIYLGLRMLIRMLLMTSIIR